MRQLIDQYVQAGQIRFDYHHFIVIDGNAGGTESQHSAEASECAKEQGQFWAYHDYLFAHQGAEASGTFSDDNLKAFAATISGIDTAKFNACLDAHRYKTTVAQDVALAESVGATQTPTVLVNGVVVTNLVDTTELKQKIDAAIAKAQ